MAHELFFFVQKLYCYVCISLQIPLHEANQEDFRKTKGIISEKRKKEKKKQRKGKIKMPKGSKGVE